MEEMNEFEEIEDRVKESGAKPKRKLGKKGKIILAVVLPIVLVIGGGGFYYAAFHPMRWNVQEKPIVKLPTKYEGNISMFPFLIPYSCDNKTPLKKYWLREYFKDYLEGYRVNETVDNITLTINNTWFSGYPGWIQSLYFNITLRSSTYIEKVAFVSDATYIEKLGNVASTVIIPSKASEKYVEKTLNAVFYNVTVFEVQRNNISLSLLDVVHIDNREVNKTLPYNFTAYIETKDKIYKMKFVFNLTNELEPYLDLQDLYVKYNGFYVPGATYFCYNSTWGKVIISNHLVPGTQYYFIEKNGVLSSIWTPRQVQYGRGI